jgi:hypothetical protein
VNSSLLYFTQSQRPLVHEPLQQSLGTLQTAPPSRQHLLLRHWWPTQQSSVLVQLPASGVQAHVPFGSQFPLQQSDPFAHTAPPRRQQFPALHAVPTQQSTSVLHVPDILHAHVPLQDPPQHSAFVVHTAPPPRQHAPDLHKNPKQQSVSSAAPDPDPDR